MKHELTLILTVTLPLTPTLLNPHSYWWSRRISIGVGVMITLRIRVRVQGKGKGSGLG